MGKLCGCGSGKEIIILEISLGEIELSCIDCRQREIRKYCETMLRLIADAHKKQRKVKINFYN